jgi:hypothetical protein
LSAICCCTAEIPLGNVEVIYSAEETCMVAGLAPDETVVSARARDFLLGGLYDVLLFPIYKIGIISLKYNI